MSNYITSPTCLRRHLDMESQEPRYRYCVLASIMTIVFVEIFHVPDFKKHTQGETRGAFHVGQCLTSVLFVFGLAKRRQKLIRDHIVEQD